MSDVINSNDESPFIDFIMTLWENKWKIIIFNFLIGIITVIYLLLQPNYFRSTVTVLVEDKNEGLNLSSVISQMVPMGLGGLGQNENILKYIRILNSRNMSDKVITKFNLIEEYELELMAEVYSELVENVSFVDNEDGSFSIHCSYKENPQAAADMANYYYEALLVEMEKIDFEQASFYRKYVEKSFKDRKKILFKKENDLKLFQEKSLLLSAEEQISASIQILSELELEKLKSEIQRDVLLHEYSSNNPMVQNYVVMVEVQQKKINEYKTSNNYSNVGYDELPKKAMEFNNYYRDFLIEEKLTEYLALQLEQAKLEESKKLSNLYLLDKAVAADKKYKPKRLGKLILISGFFLILTLIYYRMRSYFYQEFVSYKKRKLLISDDY